MRLGISTASFFGKAPTENCFDLLRQLRVDITEVFLNTFYEYEKSYIDSLIERKGCMNVHSVHALSNQFEPELFSHNQRVFGDAESTFKKICYAGYALGAKYYTFHGPLRLKNSALKIDYKYFGERVNRLIDIAGAYGISLSYENVHYAYFSEPSFFTELFKYCPKLYATLDIKQAMQGDQDVYAFMAAMGDRISTIHVCDYYKKQTCVPGTGKFNFERFFKELNKHKIEAPVLMELYAKDYSDMNAVKDSYNYLIKCSET